MKNRLVVSDAISESSECIEPPVDAITPHPLPALQKRKKQRLSPYRGIVSGSQKGDPKTETKLGDNGARHNRLSSLIQATDRVGDGLNGIALEGSLAGAEPVWPVSGFESVVQFVAQTNFHALERGVKRFGQAHILFIKTQRGVNIAVARGQIFRKPVFRKAGF